MKKSIYLIALSLPRSWPALRMWCSAMAEFLRLEFLVDRVLYDFIIGCSSDCHIVFWSDYLTIAPKCESVHHKFCKYLTRKQITTLKLYFVAYMLRNFGTCGSDHRILSFYCKIKNQNMYDHCFIHFIADNSVQVFSKYFKLYLRKYIKLLSVFLNLDVSFSVVFVVTEDAPYYLQILGRNLMYLMLKLTLIRSWTMWRYPARVGTTTFICSPLFYRDGIG